MRVMWSMTIRSRPPDLPITLSQNAPWVPFSNRPMTVSTDSSSGKPLDLLGDLVDLQPQTAADEPDVAAPHHGRDGRQQHHRHGPRPSGRPNPHDTLTAYGWL